MSFEQFQMAVNNQLDRMISHGDELFYVKLKKNELFELYLASFPEGTDPIFRERSVHDCECCKKFINKAGNIVAFIEGQLESIWDIQSENLPDFYQIVADLLSKKVMSTNISGIYRNKDGTLGGDIDRQTLESGIINIYPHFYYKLPSKFLSDEIARFRGNAETNKTVLESSLTEISLEASEIVIELIEQNQLYRGQEHLKTVKRFHSTKTQFDLISENEVNEFLWVNSAKLKETGRFKNTVIGTLLYDISSGIPLEDAVQSFEIKVAPQNYKRPTALITQAMIDKAKEKVVELGIEDSLARRYANTKDITVNNVLFIDRSPKKKVKEAKKQKSSSVFDNLTPTKSTVSDKVQKMPIDEFVATILPHIESMEVRVENSHINNLMSVIAPTNPRSPNIMKWNNPFSWSYNGEVTDSIRERVKRAGGDVEGHMRCSLSWYNYDDLDIHAIEPSGDHIYYQNKKSSSGGELDVDMNAGGAHTREPVENITWKNKSYLQEGTYKFYVHNYAKREFDAETSGFQVEMELEGKTYLFTYDKLVKNHEEIVVIEFTYSHKNGINILKSLPQSDNSKSIWNIETQKWTKVNMMLKSPNHWNGENVGNKHWFFILEDCLNPDRARGFYNEFLMNDLIEHRKVFEVLSSKMKTEYSDKQLSGVGFSSTQENHILCKVSGKFDRIIDITFAEDSHKRFDEPIIEQVVEIIGRCEVCKNDVTNVQSRLSCPNTCVSIFHTSHFLESVRVYGKCPVCRLQVTQVQVDQLVTTIVP